MFYFLQNYDTRFQIIFLHKAIPLVSVGNHLQLLGICFAERFHFVSIITNLLITILSTMLVFPLDSLLTHFSLNSCTLCLN